MLDVKNILIYLYIGMNDDNDVNDNVPVRLSFLTFFIIQTTHIVSSNLGIASTVQASVAAQSTALFSDNEYTGMYMTMVMIMLIMMMIMLFVDDDDDNEYDDDNDHVVVVVDDDDHHHDHDDHDDTSGRCIVHLDAFCWVQRDSYLPQGM